MTLEQFKDRLEQQGLGKYYDGLSAHLKNTVRLYQQSVDENTLAIGQTKIGGRPDLPPAVAWVTETNTVETTERKYLIFTRRSKTTVTKPLCFIAQVNLAETAPFDRDNVLPKTGMLYFFYSAEQEAWGFDPKDENKFKVIYWSGHPHELKRAEFPSDLPEYSRFNPCLVQIKPEVSFPNVEHEAYLGFSDEEADKFWGEVYNYRVLNKLLGYSDNIQGDMELECELVTNGLYCGGPAGYADPRAKALKPNAKNWRLLLQIDSNKENGMMWGDCGRLYFWIKEDDLLNKRFDKCWFCLQCS